MKKITFFLLSFALILRGGIQAQKTTATIIIDTPTVVNPLEKEGWTMLWHDEFEVDSIDPHVWWIQDCERKGELAYFTQRRENVSVKNGKLLISVRKEPYKNFQYTGGLVYLAQRIEPSSYIEAAVRLPKGKGLWPAFWFNGGGVYQEVDVLETYGSQTTKVDVTNHYWDSTQNRIVQDWRHVTLKKPNGKDYDLAEGLTVFGLEWTDAYLRIYVNNKLFQEVTKNIPKHPMHLILGMGLGGSAGKPNRKTPLVSTYEVEYVRVYKKNTQP